MIEDSKTRDLKSEDSRKLLASGPGTPRPKTSRDTSTSKEPKSRVFPFYAEIGFDYFTDSTELSHEQLKLIEEVFQTINRAEKDLVMNSEDESPANGGVVRQTKTAPLVGERRIPQMYDASSNKRNSQTQHLQPNQDRHQASKQKIKIKGKSSSDEQLEAELADYINDNGNERIKHPEQRNPPTNIKPPAQKRDSLISGNNQAATATKPPKKLNSQGSTANDSKSSAGGRDLKQADGRPERNSSMNRTGGSQGPSFKKKQRPEEVQNLNNTNNLGSQKSGDKFIKPHFDSSEDEIEDLTEGQKNDFEDDPDYLDLTEDKPKLAAQPKHALPNAPKAPQPEHQRHPANKPPLKNNIINKNKPETSKPAANKPPIAAKPPTTKPTTTKDKPEDGPKKIAFPAKAPQTQPKKFQSQEDVHKAEEDYEDFVEDKSGPSEAQYEDFDDHVPITSPSEGNTDKNFFDDDEDLPKPLPDKRPVPKKHEPLTTTTKEDQKKETSRVTQPDPASSGQKNPSANNQPPNILSFKKLKADTENKPHQNRPSAAITEKTTELHPLPPQPIPSKLIERMNKALSHNPPKEGDKLNLNFKEILKDAYRSFDGVKMTSTILNIDIDEMSYCFSQAILTHLRNFIDMQLVGESSPEEDYESSMDYYQRKVGTQVEQEDKALEGKQDDGVVFDESLGVGDSQNLSRNNSVDSRERRTGSAATTRPSSAAAKEKELARFLRWQASAR